MSGRVSAAATLMACVMLALVGFRDDSGLLLPAIGLAVVGVVAAKHHQAVQDAATLRAYGLKRLRIGRDRIYVPLQDGDE